MAVTLDHSQLAPALPPPPGFRVLQRQAPRGVKGLVGAWAAPLQAEVPARAPAASLQAPVPQIPGGPHSPLRTPLPSSWPQLGPGNKIIQVPAPGAQITCSLLLLLPPVIIFSPKNS